MRYPGGKGLSFRHIVNAMPEHDVYIESHLGGGAVLRRKRPASQNIGIDIDPRVIRNWKEMHPTLCHLVEADAVSFLSTYPFKGTEVVYADPPYLSATRRRERVYKYDYTRRDHEILLEVLKALPCMVLVSGYFSDLYQKELGNWNRLSFRAKTHADVREEFLWFNFESPHRLHDGRYLGGTFREREKIKRQGSNLRKRFCGLSTEERRSFFQWASAEFIDLVPAKEIE